MGVKEVRRIRDIARAKAQQELEDCNLANDDSEYWGRVILVDLKDRAANEVVEEEMILGSRKRKQISKQMRTFGAESLMAKRCCAALVARNTQIPCMESCHGKRRG
jgi:hypothetical protein